VIFLQLFFGQQNNNSKDRLLFKVESDELQRKECFESFSKITYALICEFIAAVHRLTK